MVFLLLGGSIPTIDQYDVYVHVFLQGSAGCFCLHGFIQDTAAHHWQTRVLGADGEMKCSPWVAVGVFCEAKATVHSMTQPPSTS